MAKELIMTICVLVGGAWTFLPAKICVGKHKYLLTGLWVLVNWVAVALLLIELMRKAWVIS